MDSALQIIDTLLKYVSITFLIYCCINALYKFYFIRSYKISDFRLYLITLVFVFLKLSASTLSIYNEFLLELNYNNVIGFFVVLIGFYLHNKITEPRKKFFRLFIFYLLGLYIII
mgnify:FL=1